MRKYLCFILTLLLYPVSLFYKKSDIFLISERGTDACDNGYEFYLYLKSKRIKSYFLINESNKMIEDKDKIIPYSLKHIWFYLTTNYHISSQIGSDYCSYYACRLLEEKLKILKNKKIFLQHGITYNMTDFCMKQSGVDLYICGAKREYEFVKENFGYNINQVIYTGFARWDKLYKCKIKKNQILIMPTWRKNISKTIYEINDFKKTEYYNRYFSLINNKNFTNFLEDNNINCIFYLHHEMQKYKSAFKSNSKNIIVTSENNYSVSKLLRESSLLVTDYSSVFFDFSYMNKPIAYYHFDIDSFRSNQYSTGYFDYEKDGFGPCVYDEQVLVKFIKNSIKRDFKIGKVYEKRISDFFKLRDNKNCERIYQSILNKYFY